MSGSLLLRQERLRQLAPSRSFLQALTRRLRSSWPVLLILLLPVLLLRASLFGGRAPTADDTLIWFPPWSSDLASLHYTPQNPLLSDDPLEINAWTFFTHQELTAGRFPFWNPTVAGGTPFFSAGQPAVLYPLLWLEAFIPYPFGLTVVTLLKWWLLGLGMYVFARSSLKLAQLPALIPALSFMLGSFWIVWLVHQLSWAVMLLPWLLWATERALRTSSIRRLIALALVVALIGLTGHPEMSFHVTLAGGLYACWLVVGHPAGSWFERSRLLGRAVGIYVLGVLLAAVQYLPTLRQIPLMMDPVLRAQAPISHFLPPTASVTWVVPNIWGWGSYFWGPEDYNETVFYAGAVALVLACVALLALRRRERRSEVAFFVLLVVVFGTLLYGLPPGSWLIRLPVISTDDWSRLGLLAILGVSVLAGFGCEEMLAWGQAILAPDHLPGTTSTSLKWRRRVAHPRLLLVGAGLMLLLPLLLLAIDRSYRPQGLDHLVDISWDIFWISVGTLAVWATCLVLFLRRQGWLNKRRAGAFVLGLLLCEQLLFAAPYTPQPPANLAFPETPTLARLQQTVGSARMAAAGSILPPDSMTPYALHDLRGYDPSASARYLQYMLALDPGMVNSPIICCRILTCPSLTLLSVASVAYYATLPEVDANRCAPLAPGQSLTPGPLIPLWTQGGITLWRNTLARPRFYFADTVIPSTGEPQTLAALPTLSAVGHDAIIEGGFQVSQASAEQGTIKIVTDLPGEITLRTQTAAPRWLIVDEGYDPGWQAEVDGIQKTIHPANEMFQAIMVPAGAHTLHLIYRPLSFIAGVLLSSLALLTMLGLLLGDWMLRKRRSMPPLPQQNNTQPGDERLS